MVKLVVAYGAPDDPAAFEQYYASTHTPLVHEIPNLRRFEAGKVLAWESEFFVPKDGVAPVPLLAAMLAFRDGDFSVRLPPDVTGINGKIADAFNDIVAVSDRRAHETRRVSHAVGKEGKLKQRMAVPGVTGGWADEVAL